VLLQPSRRETLRAALRLFVCRYLWWSHNDS
jgi:hypothetical protein